MFGGGGGAVSCTVVGSNKCTKMMFHSLLKKAIEFLFTLPCYYDKTKAFWFNISLGH